MDIPIPVLDIPAIDPSLIVGFIATSGLIIIELIRAYVSRRNQEDQQDNAEQAALTTLFHTDRDTERALRLAAERELSETRLELARKIGENEALKARLAWVERRTDGRNDTPSS